MVNKRDDFTPKVKKILAERVNFKCSNPECRAQTSGPQSDSTKSLNLGEAAHITAAAKGGARFNGNLTSEQRKDISNGIWLCRNCAKLIDNDRIKYNPQLLKGWKKIAEKEASDSIGRPSSLSNEKIVDKWVNLEYVEKSGLSEQLKSEGYKIYWAAERKESERIDLENWEYVLLPQENGTLVRLKVKNQRGYLVFIKKKIDDI